LERDCRIRSRVAPGVPVGPPGVSIPEREDTLDPYQSFIMGGAAVATFVGGQSSGFGLAMPGIRELLSSASCPNWANRDFLTSAEDRCSGNARGEPAAELGAPSAIDMRSIGISNNCGLAPLRPVPPRVSVCASWSWACGPMAWPRKKTQRQTCWSVLHVVALHGASHITCRLAVHFQKVSAAAKRRCLELEGN
jgi:hypothetical protein